MIGNLSQIEQLSSLLSQSQARHEVISSNLANVNTPHYHTKDVQFEDLLMAASGKMESAQEIYEVEGLTARQDGNNVDMDRELAKMTKNSLAYQTFSQLMASKLGAYRAAISGRG